MKRVVLAIAAILVLVALPAAAQSTTTQPTTTTTGNPTEERTNAAVPTHSNDPGLTATGTVESFNDGEVVLNTSTGLTHFKLLPGTLGVGTYAQGQRLSIDFSRNEQGVLLAKQIRNADEVSTMPQGITTSGAAAAGEAVESAVKNVGEAVEEGVEETLKTDVDNDGEVGTRGGTSGTVTATTTSVDTEVDTESTTLPATGSKSPLLALLGLLALGGAASLRRT